MAGQGGNWILASYAEVVAPLFQSLRFELLYLPYCLVLLTIAYQVVIDSRMSQAASPWIDLVFDPQRWQILPSLLVIAIYNLVIAIGKCAVVFLHVSESRFLEFQQVNMPDDLQVISIIACLVATLVIFAFAGYCELEQRRERRLWQESDGEEGTPLPTVFPPGKISFKYGEFIIAIGHLGIGLVVCYGTFYPAAIMIRRAAMLPFG